jgi:gliding motility-associated-like protein
MKKLLLLLLLIPTLVFGQCAGNQSFTLNPAPVNGTYQPGTVVTMCYTMNGWDTGFGSNWIEGFGITLGPGWVSYTPVSGPDDCGGAVVDQGWLWLETITNNAGTLTVGPGYFYEGPTGVIDGNPGNDWGDFGTNCLWTFCVQLQVSDECDPLSLLIEVTPYADGTMGSWGNEACFDPPFQVFGGTIAGGDVNTDPITPCPDTVCDFTTSVYAVNNTPGSIYDWQLSGGGALTTDGGHDVSVYWGDVDGDYILSVQETTADGCVGEIQTCSVHLVNHNNFVTLGVSEYRLCPGEIVPLFASPSNGVWTGEHVVGPFFNADEPGIFYPTYQLDVYGCLFTGTTTVYVRPPFEALPITASSNFIDFCYQPYRQIYEAPDSAGFTYTWYVDGEIFNGVGPIIEVDYPDSSMSHTIEVFATDSIGCKSEKTGILIDTQACLRLYVPQSFTPNNDGYNDAFTVVGSAIYEPRLTVYNRWGAPIFFSNSLRPGWNGNDGNGYYCEPGIYPWYFSYKDDRGFNHSTQGHVVLIR